MITFHAHIGRVAAFVAVCSMSFYAFARQHSPYDEAIPEPAQVSASLDLAKQLSARSTLSPKEILLLYRAEKTIGRIVWGLSPRYKGQDFPQLDLFSSCHDSTIAAHAVAYIRANQNRFRVVDDGWKGEENFWEPTDALLLRMKQLHPQTIEAMEIEFDLEFNQFIRRFWIDPDAQGKTCEQYYREELEGNSELRESYTELEIAKWPAECAKEREQFAARRSQLLKKYKNAPFTKVLSDIDVTTIVVHHRID
jgi:hypothetical protein